MTPQIYENAQARPEHHLFAWTLPCEMLERRTYVSAKIAFVMLLLDVHLADTAVPLPCSVIPRAIQCAVIELPPSCTSFFNMASLPYALSRTD